MYISGLWRDLSGDWGYRAEWGYERVCCDGGDSFKELSFGPTQGNKKAT